MSGQFDFAAPAMAVQQELLSGNGHLPELSDEARAVQNFKKLALMLIGSLGQLALKGKLDLREEQEIMMSVADIIIATYLAESCYLRYVKHPNELKKAMTELYFREANEQIRKSAIEAVGSFVKEELQAGFLSGINTFTSYPIKNVKALSRMVAAEAIAKSTYPLKS